MKNIRKEAAAVLTACLAAALLAGCGKTQQSSAYVSPSFQNQQAEEASYGDASVSDATLTEAIRAAASAGDASVSDAVPASLTDSVPMGVYENNTYYNGLAGFQLKTDEAVWYFYDADEVATATDVSVEDVKNYWTGLKSPYDGDTTYCAIAVNRNTGSNIVISYINPEKYRMPELTAEKYLQSSLSRHKGASLGEVEFLGNTYHYLDAPSEDETAGHRIQFALERKGLIVLITMTVQDEKELESMLEMFSPIPGTEQAE